MTVGKTWIWAALALTLTAGTAACSASGGNPAIPAHSPSSATSSATVSTAAALAATPGDKAVDALPHYQPSKVVSEAAGHFQLTTIASVSKVASFYKTALKGRGWRILYAGRNAGSTDIVAMLGTTGVGISISHADPAGTAILVLACDC
jgi:CubicO group peptidase (beta-lactamase class C family)